MGRVVKGYSERKIPILILNYFKATEYLLGRLELAEEVRCHELARAVWAVLGFDHYGRVVDGKYGRVEHSWIELWEVEGLAARWILDVYACGRLPQVQVVDLFFTLPHEDAYQRGEPRDDINQAMVNSLARAIKALVPLP